MLMRVSVASATFSTSLSTSTNLVIGADIAFNYKLSGKIQEVRISNGLARYTSNFSPSTSSFSNDGNTSLLLHLNGNVTDSSSNNFTITNTNVTFTAVGAFTNTDYGIFNGTSSYLTAPNESYFNFGSGNFTFDYWINFSVLPTSGNEMVMVNKLDATGTYGYQLFIQNTSGVYSLYFYTDLFGNSSNGVITISTGTWNHIAGVRNGSTWTIYFNGNSVLSFSHSGSITSNTASLYLGCSFAANYGLNFYTNANIQEFRVSNIARWTTNFTPPTSPYSSVSGSTNTGMFALIR